jgi:hypothetical protein
MKALSPRAGCRCKRQPAMHSLYNPEREAERYIDALAPPNAAQYFILLECGLGYVVPCLRKKNNRAKIVSLHISDRYMSDKALVPKDNIPDAEWSPESPLSCADFLEKEIEDIESDKIKIIEWKPARALNGAQYLALLKEAALFIKRADANKRTAAHFSALWRRNATKNIRIARRAGHDCDIFNHAHKDIIVCAAGPSLEDDAHKIKDAQTHKTCAVLCASSAFDALLWHDIVPDIVITSDGGNWARFHLHPLVRSRKKLFLIASLHAALLSDLSAFPIMLFSDGGLEQDDILEQARLPRFSLPARGTVAAHAIDAALRLTHGSIYVTGLDLRNNDIRSHARPYALDMFLWERSNRFNPYYHAQYARTRAIEEGGAYDVYAAWFKKEREKYQGRIFSLSNGAEWTID